MVVCSRANKEVYLNRKTDKVITNLRERIWNTRNSRGNLKISYRRIDLVVLNDADNWLSANILCFYPLPM